MFNAKFQYHQPSGSEEEELKMFFMGMTSILFMMLPSQGGSELNLTLIGKVVSEKSTFENNGHIHVYRHPHVVKIIS